MKKTICLLLTTAMLFSICACGGPSKKAMEKEAVNLNWEEVYDDYLANETRAKNDYNGKIVKWTAEVYHIYDNYVIMANETYNGQPLNGIQVYLSKEDIIELKKYKKYTIIGVLKLGSFPSIKKAFLVK